MCRRERCYRAQEPHTASGRRLSFFPLKGPCSSLPPSLSLSLSLSVSPSLSLSLFFQRAQGVCETPWPLALSLSLSSARLPARLSRAFAVGAVLGWPKPRPEKPTKPRARAAESFRRFRLRRRLHQVLLQLQETSLASGGAGAALCTLRRWGPGSATLPLPAASEQRPGEGGGRGLWGLCNRGPARRIRHSDQGLPLEVLLKCQVYTTQREEPTASFVLCLVFLSWRSHVESQARQASAWRRSPGICAPGASGPSSRPGDPSPKPRGLALRDAETPKRRGPGRDQGTMAASAGSSRAESSTHFQAPCSPLPHWGVPDIPPPFFKLATLPARGLRSARPARGSRVRDALAAASRWSARASFQWPARWS